LVAALATVAIDAATLPEFEVGQYWALRDARHPGVEILVVKIDRDPVLDRIIFVDIEKVMAKDGREQTLSFVPVSQSALRLSVGHYLRRVSDPGSFDDRLYRKWKAQSVNGKRLVVTGALGDVVDKLFP